MIYSNRTPPPFVIAMLVAWTETRVDEKQILEIALDLQ